MNEICFAVVFVKIYTIQIDNLFVCHAKLCYSPDIFSYIFCHIFMKYIDIFTIFSGIRNTTLRHILEPLHEHISTYLLSYFHVSLYFYLQEKISPPGNSCYNCSMVERSIKKTNWLFNQWCSTKWCFWLRLRPDRRRTRLCWGREWWGWIQGGRSHRFWGWSWMFNQWCCS